MKYPNTKYEVLSDWKPGDGIVTLESNNKSKAFQQAKSDTKGDFHESHVYQYNDNGDIVNHWIFKAGKQQQSMF